MMAAGTVVAKNYLSFARVLADSLRRWHPELPFYVALVDKPEGLFDPAGEQFQILDLEKLRIPRLPDYCFRYTRREAVSAAKPYLIGALLDAGHESVLYLDADMEVLGDLGPLLDRVGRRPLTLTPHTVAPGMPVEEELNILQCGVFNGGMVGATETAETREFLRWWQERTREHCRHAIGEGMHLDQRWLDFAPSFVPGLAVERDRAYNVAYWNLAERPDAEEWRLFHYSGFDPMQPERMSRYWPERRMTAGPLFERYAARLMTAGYRETREWPYAFDRFDNGEPIPSMLREAYRKLGRAAEYFVNPLGAEMREWWADRSNPEEERDLEMWRHAAGERLRKLQEANVLLAGQQEALDRLRNDLAGERGRTGWLGEQMEMFRRAAEERLELLERMAAKTRRGKRGLASAALNAYL